MANDVENIFSFDCSRQLEAAVDKKLLEIAAKIRRGKYNLGDYRTKWECSWDEDWRFISHWGVAESLQDTLTRELALVDPAVVVTNYFQEEFDQFEGIRINRYIHGAVKTKYEPSEREKLKRLRRPQKRCVTVLRGPGKRGLVNLSTEHHFE